MLDRVGLYKQPNSRSLASATRSVSSTFPSFNSTMATTKRGNDQCALGRREPRRPSPLSNDVDPFAFPRKKHTFWQRLGLKFANCVPWLCGVSEPDWFVSREDQDKFTEMREEMRASYGIASHLPEKVDPSLVGAVVLLERASDVELSEPVLVLNEMLKKRQEGKLTDDQLSLQISQLHLTGKMQAAVNDYSSRKPVWSARFAAGMVLTLRTKFGPLVRNEANMLLVQREYLRITRMNHVRANVVVDHEPYIISQFFQQTAAEQRLAARRRLPGWLRRALDSTELSGGGVYA